MDSESLSIIRLLDYWPLAWPSTHGASRAIVFISGLTLVPLSIGMALTRYPRFTCLAETGRLGSIAQPQGQSHL